MSSGLGRYYFAKALPAVAILVVVAVGCLVWYVVQEMADGSRTDSGARPSAASSGETSPEPMSEERKRDRAEIDRQVKAFSRLYFSFSLNQTAEDVERRVAPYVTDNFLQSTQFGIGSSEADRAMIAEGASLKVRAVTGMEGIFLDADTAQGDVRLRFTKLDRDGNVVFEGREATQTMTVVRQGDTWLIDSVPYS